MNYRIFVDNENNAEKWWDGGGRELWKQLVSPYFGINEIIVSGEVLDAFLDAAEAIPGYSDGPEYAENPFCIYEVEY